MFGPDEKLINYYSSQSQTGMRIGAARGKYQAPTPDQPQDAPARESICGCTTKANWIRMDFLLTAGTTSPFSLHSQPPGVGLRIQ